MTTPVPRVRVKKNPWNHLRPWSAHCPYECPARFAARYSWGAAMADAVEHTENPCDGLRLAALLARLEGLRDVLATFAARPTANDVLPRLEKLGTILATADDPYVRGTKAQAYVDSLQLGAIIREARRG